MAETSAGALPEQIHTLPVADRMARGRALRERQPRVGHATWTAPAGRRDPIEVLIEQGQARLPTLLPLRHARMKVSPFAFFRGGAAVMTEDLAGTAATGLRVQACGDCHCLNFGGFATPERRLVFDVNDFDETAVAPWEWDVKRLAIFVLATLDVLDKDARLDLARTVARSYRETMAEIAGLPLLEAWYRGLVLDSADKAEEIGIGAEALRKAQGFLTHAALISVAHRGERVVRGQRLLQAASDVLLGFATGPTGRHIYVRQLRDAKIKPKLETMAPKDFARYASACARTADAVVLSAYLGKSATFDEAIGAFAQANAKQAESDHEMLVKATRTGQLRDLAQDS